MSQILKGFTGFHLANIPLLKPSGSPKSNIIPVRFGGVDDSFTLTPHQPFQRIFIDSPGFERNEEWAQTMWGLAENASKNLETGKFKTAYEVLDSFSKAYQKFTGKGEWFNLPNSGRPPWELSKISGPGTKQTSILRRGPFLERIKAMAQSGLHGSCAVDKAKQMNLYLYNYKTIDHLHFQQQDGIQLTGTVMGKNASGDELVGWLYVDKDTSQKCIKKVEILTKEILSYRGNLTPENQEKAIKAIAKVHWWMIHSIAFNGGTAGMSDLLTKTLFDTIGMETSLWKKGAVPDIEVFVRSMDDYVNHYTSFFQYPPRVKKEKT